MPRCRIVEDAHIRFKCRGKRLVRFKETTASNAAPSHGDATASFSMGNARFRRTNAPKAAGPIPSRRCSFLPCIQNTRKDFLYYFSVLRIFHLTFNLTRCMVLKILRQTAQQNGSSDPLRSAVRDCLGYTVRTMRKVFRLKFASAGRSSASSSAVTIALNFRPPARKGSSRTII